MASTPEGIRSNVLALAALTALLVVTDGSKIRADISTARGPDAAARNLPGGRAPRIASLRDSGLLAVSALESLEPREGAAPRRIVSLAPVRWLDADRKWREVDATFRLSPSGGYVTASDSLEGSFPERADESFTVRRAAGGPGLTWRGGSLELRRSVGDALVLAAAPRSVQAVLGADGSLLYSQAWPGASERYRLEPGMVKHEVVLERMPFVGPFDELVLSWMLGASEAGRRIGEALPAFADGAPLALEPDGEGGFRLLDGSGELSLWLPAPFLMEDLEALELDRQVLPGLPDGSDPAELPATPALRLEWHAESVAEGLRVELRLPTSELLARADRFPLVIDRAIVDVASLDGLLQIFAADRFDLLGEKRGVAVGDLNGDGILDLVLGVQRGDGPDDMRTDAGEVHVLFGPLSPGQRDLSSDKGDVVIVGADAGDTLGWSLAVGDLDGDGIDDLLMGAPFADGQGNLRSGSGEAHVLLGPLPPGGLIDLSLRPGDAVLFGRGPSHGLGHALAIGDVTGDGIGDIIASAIRSDGPGGTRIGAGAVHVVAGPFLRGPARRLVDLTVGDSDLVVHGESAGDQLGAALVVGDLDGDGLPDLVVSSLSSLGLDDSRPRAGEIHVLLAPLSGGSLDLAIDRADARLFGASAGDLLGHDLAIGDLSGDGIGDLVAGAHLSDGPGGARDRAGAVAVVFGPFTTGMDRDLGSEGADVTVHGAAATDLAGWSVATGDLSGDGRDDLALSVVSGDGPLDSRPGAGELHAFFGPFATGTVLDLAVDGADLEVQGAQASDQLGFSLVIADLNGDGVGDLAAAAKTARGPGESRLAAGEAVLVMGVASGCRSDSDCDDGLDCTLDSCDPETGECSSDESPCNLPPSCEAGPDLSVGCREALLTGAVAEDPNRDALEYLWQSSDPAVVVLPASGSLPAGDGPRILPLTVVTLDESAAPCGRFALLTLMVHDGRGGRSSCHRRVLFSDEGAPELLGVPPDATVSCDAVPAPAAVQAVDDCDPVPSTSFEELLVEGDCPGRHRLVRTWRAVDACGHASEAVQVLDVVDDDPPVVRESFERARCLWPPNHRMVHFDRSDFAPEIEEGCSGVASWRFVDCASNQPVDGTGDGSTEPDCVVDEDGEGFSVRAERSGVLAWPRRYAVAIVATDGCGNESPPTVIASIEVSHDRGLLVGSGDCMGPSRR